METEIVIAGGGLSGLALADRLERAGVDYLLLEARDRLGGRIAHVAAEASGKCQYYDVGPTWFWQGQPRMAALAKRLDVGVFQQYSAGELTYEDEQGQVMTGRGYASMAGSLRLDGGMSALISGLSNGLTRSKLLVGNRLEHVERKPDGIALTSIDPSSLEKTPIKCQKIVLALPPRVAAETIHFTPSLGESVLSAMLAIPTWMAGHAKVVALYEEPFWRKKGLSGDAMSRRGPMMEIHDASPFDGGPYALFGFVGVPATHRMGRSEALVEASKQQFGRLFGQEALMPLSITLMDWAFQPETAVSHDHAPLGSHPTYGLPDKLKSLWDGKLQLGSTEAAPQFGGYLEGALEAAERVFDSLLEKGA